MANRLAVSLALPDTEACLDALRELAPRISKAELRLDLMNSFDLPRLIAEAPCPLIITCRPLREGGQFKGSEAERLHILTRAMDLGCAYVDVEWDVLANFRQRPYRGTRLIASRHWLESMPPNLWTAYEFLRERADAVKLVTLARRPADVLPIFDFLKWATGPVIGLAMGEAGRLTRLMSPIFRHCLLTYGALTNSELTAPGQLTINEMIELYHLNAVSPRTAVHIHLSANSASARAIIEKNADAEPGEVLHVPFIVSPEDTHEVVPGLRALLPNSTLSADQELRTKPLGF